MHGMRRIPVCESGQSRGWWGDRHRQDPCPGVPARRRSGHEGKPDDDLDRCRKQGHAASCDSLPPVHHPIFTIPIVRSPGGSTMHVFFRSVIEAMHLGSIQRSDFLNASGLARTCGIRARARDAQRVVGTPKEKGLNLDSVQVRHASNFGSIGPSCQHPIPDAPEHVGSSGRALACR